VRRAKTGSKQGIEGFASRSIGIDATTLILLVERAGEGVDAAAAEEVDRRFVPESVVTITRAGPDASYRLREVAMVRLICPTCQIVFAG
jgi:hypothetical protein